MRISGVGSGYGSLDIEVVIRAVKRGEKAIPLMKLLSHERFYKGGLLIKKAWKRLLKAVINLVYINKPCIYS
jgi:hypothetical protein